MTRFPKWSIPALLVGALALAGACEKQPTGYTPDPNRPEGVTTTQAKLVAYHRPSEYRATYYARSEAPSSSLDASVSRLASVMGSGPGFFYLWWP